MDPEESESWTVGFVLQPTAAVSFGMDYWNYKITDSIGFLGENAIFGDTAKYSNLFVRCSEAKPSEVALIDACGIPGGDPLAYIVNTQLNLGNYKTSGIDLTAQWTPAATEYGRWSLGLRGTYVLKYEYQFEKDGQYNNNLGTYFNGAAVFRWQSIFNVGWQYGPWAGVLLNRYRAGYDDANAAAGLVDPVDEHNKVGAWSVWDLTFTYTGFKGFTLTAGVLNLLNTDPPFTNKGDGFQVGYDERYANPLGRQWLVRGVSSRIAAAGDQMVVLSGITPVPFRGNARASLPVAARSPRTHTATTARAPQHGEEKEKVHRRPLRSASRAK